MGLSSLKTESLLLYYDAVRSQVDADKRARHAGSPYQLAAGDPIRSYAYSLQDEMCRRAVAFQPIEWAHDGLH